MKKLSGKTALITGAGRGIGRATAILFAGNGADVILVARTASELMETATLCEAADDDIECTVAPLDLAKPHEIDRLFKQVMGSVSGIDFLINNAAVFVSAPTDKLPVDEFQRLLAVNLIAPYHLSQKAIPLMEKHGGGAIVNISSKSGCVGTTKFPGFGAYNISKYGLWGLTEILALELKQRNIRVNQVSLAGVDTAMFRQAAPPGLKPALTLDDVAREILFLASDESAPMTGENVILDGATKRVYPDD